MKILIFENSKQIAESLISLISETMKDVAFYKADSFGEALFFLKECNPDVVLLDMKYPGNRSVELLKKVKANDKTVLIALFSEADEFSLRQWEQYGADFIFDKYADFEKIPEIIKAISEMVTTE